MASSNNQRYDTAAMNYANLANIYSGINGYNLAQQHAQDGMNLANQTKEQGIKNGADVLVSSQ